MTSDACMAVINSGGTCPGTNPCTGAPGFASCQCNGSLPGFQNVGGVPGAAGQPPDWWTPTPLQGSLTGRWVDDPRWQGASSYSSVSDNSRFRALVETVGTQKFLVVSWVVKADVTGAADYLYFGIWDESSARGNVFRLARSVATDTTIDGATYVGGAFDGRFFHKIGGSPWALNNPGGLTLPPLPNWLKASTRVDVWCSAGTCGWAVRMRIPIDATADVASANPAGVRITSGGAFRFWYEIQDNSSVGTTTYAWPSGLSVAEELPSPTCTVVTGICFPVPDPAGDPDSTPGWSRFREGSTCPGEVALQAGHIYNNTPANIQVNLTGANVFHARPVNLTGGNKSGDSIKATFKLANWGSAPGLNPTWAPICTDVVGNSGTIASTGQFDIVCTYTIPPGDRCKYVPLGSPCPGGGTGTGERTPDQSLLVELSSNDVPVFLSPSSRLQSVIFNGGLNGLTLRTEAAPP